MLKADQIWYIDVATDDRVSRTFVSAGGFRFSALPASSPFSRVVLLVVAIQCGLTACQAGMDVYKQRNRLCGCP